MRLAAIFIENPIRTKTPLVTELEHYPYSSFQFYVSPEKAPHYLNPYAVVRYFQLESERTLAHYVAYCRTIEKKPYTKRLRYGAFWIVGNCVCIRYTHNSKALLCTDANQFTTYKFKGNKVNKTLTLASSAAALLEDYHEEYNLTQPAIIEIALAEFFERHGYKQKQLKLRMMQFVCILFVMV